ncbi:hypothetical protein PEDI_53430 [Persicobacter diffluens]|uniref:Uncharacterized protein n=1 Tax=Persicobacter diffluens TaxID=981 RepID=A0AAN4W342_9BACT|nr:hypothetical protein PEDI_53430 [Persicobacter diffluens]
MIGVLTKINGAFSYILGPRNNVINYKSPGIENPKQKQPNGKVSIE